MAFIRQEDDEEQQQGASPLAPGASSGGGMIGGLAPSGQPVQNQQTPQQKQGSGSFTNLSNWLDAGKGRDKLVKDTGKQLLSTEQTNYNTVAQPLRDAKFDPVTMTDDQVNQSLGLTPAPVYANTGVLTPKPAAQLPGVLGSGAVSGSLVSAPKTQQTTTSGAMPLRGVAAPALAGEDPDSGMKRLEGWLNQDFTGPDKMTWDPNNENMRGLDALSATDTAGKQLAGDQQYTAGSRRLDTSVLGADAASQKAIAKNKAKGTKFLGDAATETQSLMERIQGFKDTAKAGRDDARARLGGVADKIYSDVDQRVRDAAAKDQETQNRLNDPLQGNRPTRKVTQGNGASEGNVITGQESTALERLGKLIGSRQIADTGDYTPWSIEDTENPDPRADYAEGLTDRHGNATDYTVDEQGNRVPIKKDATVAATETLESRGMNYDSQAALQSGKYVFDFATGGIKDAATGEIFAPGADGSWAYVWDPATGTLKKAGG